MLVKSERESLGKKSVLSLPLITGWVVFERWNERVNEKMRRNTEGTEWGMDWEMRSCNGAEMRDWITKRLKHSPIKMRDSIRSKSGPSVCAQLTQTPALVLKLSVLLWGDWRIYVGQRGSALSCTSRSLSRYLEQDIDISSIESCFHSTSLLWMFRGTSIASFVFLLTCYLRFTPHSMVLMKLPVCHIYCINFLFYTVCKSLT